MKGVLAIDFDGTIVENKYPEIGRPRTFAFETLKKLQESGYLLVLWTCRSGAELDDAVAFCKKNGVEFYAVNSSYPGEAIDEKTARKIDVDMYIDDRNFGGLPSWGEIYQKLCPEGGEVATEEKKGFFSRLFR